MSAINDSVKSSVSDGVYQAWSGTQAAVMSVIK